MRIFKQVIIASLVILMASYILLNNLLSVKHTLASSLNLPEPSQYIDSSKRYSDPVLRGLKIDPQNPLNIEFIFDSKSSDLVSEKEASKSIEYFLSALTIDSKDLWVNLSPYEEDRIINSYLAQTQLGKDLLAQDYVLKQFSSSVSSPKNRVGKKYWQQLVDTLQSNLNKIWIVPDRASIYTNETNAYITDASLKVMLEEDYLANKIEKNVNSDSSNLMRDLIVPEVEFEVNNGKLFSPLRQLYSSIILAKWFKQSFYESFYANYFSSAKIQGIELDDKEVKDKVFKLYVEAFKQGVYKETRVVKDPVSNKKLRKQYFCGGAAFYDINTNSSPIDNVDVDGNAYSVKSSLIAQNLRRKALLLNKYDQVLWDNAADSVDIQQIDREFRELQKRGMGLSVINRLLFDFKPVLNFENDYFEALTDIQPTFLSQGGNDSITVSTFDFQDQTYILRNEVFDINDPNAAKNIAESLRAFVYQKQLAKMGYAPDVYNISITRTGDLFTINLISQYGGPTYSNMRLKDRTYTQERANKHVLQIAEEINYLHSNNIVFADLKQRNVVVDPVTDKAKLIDLGMAQKNKVLAYNASTGKSYGTPTAFDPHIIRMQQVYPTHDHYHTKESDVFALATVLYFAYTGKQLFDHITVNTSEDTIMQRIAAIGDERIVKLLQQMISYDPHKRPVIGDVVMLLRRIAEPRTAAEINGLIKRTDNSIKNLQKAINKQTKIIEKISNINSSQYHDASIERKKLTDAITRFQQSRKELEEELKYSSSSLKGGIDLDGISIEQNGTAIKFANVDVDFDNFSGFSYQINDIGKISDLKKELSNS